MVEPTAHEAERDYEIIPPPKPADYDRPEDFLTPEQRLDAIAEVLADIALDAMRKKPRPEAEAQEQAPPVKKRRQSKGKKPGST